MQKDDGRNIETIKDWRKKFQKLQMFSTAAVFICTMVGYEVGQHDALKNKSTIPAHAKIAIDTVVNHATKLNESSTQSQTQLNLEHK